MSTTPLKLRELYALLSKFMWLMTAVAIMLFGWGIISVLANMPSWMYWIGVIFIFILGILAGWTNGFLQSLYAYVLAYWKPSHPVSKPNLLDKPVEVARISYKLDDPLDQDKFDEFLDKDGFYLPPNPNVRLSASQIIETKVLEQIEEFEKRFHGQVTIEAEIQRGSLTVTLAFLATAYTLTAQYNDFIESVSRARNQLRSIFSTMDGAYSDLTERNIRVNGNISVKSRSRIANNTSQPNMEASHDYGSPSPVTVTNSISPPANNSDFNITVNIPDREQSSYGCSFTILILFVLIGITSVWYSMFLEEVEQKIVLDRLIEIVQYGLSSAGEFLLYLSKQVQSFSSS